MATKFKPNKKGIVTGTKKKDKITWTSSKDWKKAITVNALAGNDVINFKKSKYKKNKLNGGDGNDVIYGGTNIDIINGGKGNDKLYGYAGNDSILAGKGNDTVYGGNGNDTIKAGAGNDTVKGGAGNDKIYGQSGTNQLYGEAGNDSITGGTGTDKIWGGAGNDTINAGNGTNTIYLNKKEGTDTVLNGGGTDAIVFSQETNFNNMQFYYSGNDLLFTANGITASLKDFAKGGHLNTLTQFIDMAEVFSATGYHNIDYDNTDDTFLDIAHDYYIYSNGEQQNEIYDYMKLSRYNAIAEGYVDTNIVIDDKGGTDTLNFDADCSQLSFFFDVKRDGDNFVLGDDLIFTSDLHNYIYEHAEGDYSTLTIKNAFGDGKMETLAAEDNLYHLNYNFLTSNEQVNGVDTVYMELVSWLTNDGSAYGSISEALGSEDAADALYTIYSDCIGDYTNTWKLA